MMVTFASYYVSLKPLLLGYQDRCLCASVANVFDKNSSMNTKVFCHFRLILMQQLVTNSSEELSLIVAAAPAADIAVDEDSRMLK